MRASICDTHRSRWRRARLGRDLELREAVDQWESPPDRHDRGCAAAVASSARCTCVIPPAKPTERGQ